MLHQWARKRVVAMQFAKQKQQEGDYPAGESDVGSIHSDASTIENVAARKSIQHQQQQGTQKEEEDSEEASFLLYWLLLANLFLIRVPFPVDNSRESNAIIMFLIGFCAVKAAPPRGGAWLRTWCRKYWPFLFLAFLVMDYVKGGPWVGVFFGHGLRERWSVVMDYVKGGPWSWTT